MQLKFENMKSFEYFLYKQCDLSAKTDQMNIFKHLKHPRLCSRCTCPADERKPRAVFVRDLNCVSCASLQNIIPVPNNGLKYDLVKVTVCTVSFEMTKSKTASLYYLLSFFSLDTSLHSPFHLTYWRATAWLFP